MPSYSTLLTHNRECPREWRTCGVVQADHVAGVGVSTTLAVLGRTSSGAREAVIERPVRSVAHGHVLGEVAGADPHEGDPVAWRGSMLAWKL